MLVLTNSTFRTESKSTAKCRMINVLHGGPRMELSHVVGWLWLDDECSTHETNKASKISEVV